MKKSLFSFFILLISLSAGAKSVSEQEALAIAKSFISSNTLTRSGSTELTLVWTGQSENTKSLTDAPYYIYNVDNGGFVMVSGDTKAEPVLAYSNERNFKVAEMPANVAFWMNEMKSHIENLRSMNNVANPSIEEWSAMLYAQDKNSADTILLRTALWDQGVPYNAYTPDNMPTGCVATAMSIIMHFHKWPDAGQGTLPTYSYELADGTKKTIKGYDLGYPYQWDIMPYELDQYEIDTERTRAIARLMSDCGVMAQASYDRYGTGAVIMDIDQPISDYMKYDNSAKGLQLAFHTVDEWKSIMKENLLNRQPILYGALEPTASIGHAFVIDGIDEKGRFHINFGWSGADNGYYAMPHFSTYSASHHMVCNIKPDEGGKQEDLMINYQRLSGLLDKTTNLSVETIETDKEYILKGSVANALNNVYNGYIAACKVGRDGTIHEFVSDTTSLYIEDLEGYYIAEYEMDIIITTDIKIGDYIALYYKGDNNGDWRRMNTYMEQDMNIYLTDRYYIDEVTSVSYSKEDSLFVINTKEKADFVMYNSDGADVTGSIVNEGGVITIDRKMFQPGNYTIELIVSEDDNASFQVVF